MSNVKSLSQYQTPSWVCERLLELYFHDLGKYDKVIEPSCGDGRFLHAFPEHVPAIGVEIDPVLAAQAIERTGRRVIVGDFRNVRIDVEPTAIIGNPPFRAKVIVAFMERAYHMLQEGGRVGFVLPCYAMQTARTVVDWSRRWSIRADMIPRNCFHTAMQAPLAFVTFTKHGAHRVIVGLAMYHETVDTQSMNQRFRKLLHASRPYRSVWRAVTEAAVEALGGEAELSDIYLLVGGARPTKNPFWKEKVRQIAQAHLERVSEGRYRAAA